MELKIFRGIKASRDWIGVAKLPVNAGFTWLGDLLERSGGGASFPEDQRKSDAEPDSSLSSSSTVELDLLMVLNSVVG